VPWAPVTDYSFEARKAIEGRHPELIKSVFAPKLVIDAGCGPDAVLVKLLVALDIETLGFDVQIPRRHINRRLVRGDITDPNVMPDGAKPFADLVICREVFEHLTVQQIRQAVTNCCRLTSQYVYVTTRFHPNPASLLDVATSDGLDPTHISLLNQDLLRVLFVLEGFKRRADLEQQMDWQQKGRALVYERAA
jgi:hypothetical protein